MANCGIDLHMSKQIKYKRSFSEQIRVYTISRKVYCFNFNLNFVSNKVGLGKPC